MLTHRPAVVRDQHIAGVDILPTVNGDAIENREAEDIGEKDRNAATRLRNEAAFGVDDADGIILIFVDQRTEGRARQVCFDLVGDGLEKLTDDLKRDRIDAWCAFDTGSS